MVFRVEVICLENVWVQHDGVPILEDVNLVVREGDFLGVIGPNGGGKTTLLRTILGLVRPTRGRVTVLGSSPLRGRRFVGYVPQYSSFDRDFPLSVWDAVLMGRLGHTGCLRKYTDEDKRVAADALRAVDVFALRDRQIGCLSWGQRQRVLIARALATEPRVLLLDEPAASLDSRVEAGLYDLLRSLNTKVTIVMVSHDIGAISAYVKSIACLNRKLICHDSREITRDMLNIAYECPVDLIAHGLAHRVLDMHDEVPATTRGSVPTDTTPTVARP
ncbi:MAG: ABC transporter ATP-binding protein [Firmicutes bacterium]|nr:ABC transporter ATP-binding protein [Bacillota bacterium]MDH7495794.1 ABC transporter ATP-binding protein [Bacillota bacterium]